MTGSVRLGALVALLTVVATHADASCYADYKAKRDDPYGLHYGVIELPDAACRDETAAADEVGSRIGREGWMLLDLMSLFDEGALEEKRDRAGKFYLRF